MAKNNNKTQKTETTKGNVAAQKPQGSNNKGNKKPTETSEIPVVPAEEVETPVTPSNNRSKKDEALKSMSPDSKVALATLMQKRYIDNPDAGMKYSQKFLDEMDNLIDATAMMAILDLREEAIAKGVDIELRVNGTKAFQVVEACKLLGINLPKPKALPDGQLNLQFKDANLDPTIQNAVDNEKIARKRIEDQVPELDPSKMTTDEELKAALEYQMRSTPNVLKSLINTIEWLRSYRNFKATTADEKLKLEDRTIGVWIDEILSLIKPTLLLTGLGRAVYVNASQDGTPLTAHCTVRKNATEEDGKCVLTEKQIAEVVVTLLKANATFTLSKEPEKMKGKTIADDKALQNLFSGNEQLIERILKKEDAVDKKIYAMVQKQYYPNPEGDMSSKMHTKLGQLMNLYLPEAEKMEYPEIQDVQEYPESTPAQPVEEKKN